MKDLVDDYLERNQEAFAEFDTPDDMCARPLPCCSYPLLLAPASLPACLRACCRREAAGALAAASASRAAAAAAA